MAGLLAEAIHGDDDVLQPLLDTSALFEAALADWLRTLIAGSARAARRRGRARDPARALRRDGRVPAAARSPPRRARRRARELAHVLLVASDPITAEGSRHDRTRVRLRPLDALDPTLYVRGVAHDIFDWLRVNDPVHWDERNQPLGDHQVRGHLDVERQPELFCSAQGIRPRGGGAGDLSIVSIDDPEHAPPTPAREPRASRRRASTQMFDHIRERRTRARRRESRRVASATSSRTSPSRCRLIVIAELLGLAGRGSRAARRVVRHDDERRGRRGRRRSEAAGSRRSVGGVRHVPRRPARGAARAHPKDDLISILLPSADSGALHFREDEVQAHARRRAVCR